MRISVVGLCLFLLGTAAVAQETEPASRQEGDRLFELIDDVWIEVNDAIAPQSVRYLPARLWTDGVVPIRFEVNYPAPGIQVVWNACQHIESISSVDCVAFAGQENFVTFRESTVNESVLGMRGGEQIIDQFNTGNEGIVTHEILHALGFLHQHQAPNRDISVRIVSENIVAGAEGNFTRIANSLVMGEYDFCSIMHYSENAFSNGNGATIVVRGIRPDCTIGQRQSMTVADMLGLAEAYGVDQDDRNFVIVPDLSRQYFSLGGNEDRIMRLFGLDLNITEKFSHGRPVNVFPRPAGPGELGQGSCISTQCDYNASHQIPAPGQLVEFGSEVSIRLTQSCYPVDYC